MDLEKAVQIAKEAGFTNAAPMDVSTIRLMPEVRQMCEQNTCGMYGKNWCCPPGVGTLEDCEKKLAGYTSGILVQTVGELEDAFDGEGMMEAEAQHRKNTMAARELLEEAFPGVLTVGAGTCTRCKTCTWPDEPCRFGDSAFASMEAYGMLVTQVCQDNQMPYYYGSDRIAYMGCFLFP